MNYEAARSLIRSGDLLAFEHGKWRTWREIKTNLVRMFRRSTYSHVGTAVVMKGRVWIIEAVVPKVRIDLLSEAGSFYLIPLHAEWKPETEEFAFQSIGANYSELTAIRAHFEELEDGNIQECAALVREIMKRDGIDLGKRSTPDEVIKAALLRENVTITYVENGEEKE